MEKVLFATTNPAKVGNYKELLAKQGIELLTIADLGFELDIDENGKDAIENARIKAKAYFEKTGIPSIGMDNNLFIEELPNELQPGTHVRRINGKTLSDEEMIAYYTELVRKYGGKLTAKWVYGMVICTENGESQMSWNKDHFYFVSEPCNERRPGYPLDSISIVPEFNKYLAQMTVEEKSKSRGKDNSNQVADFIVKSVKAQG